MFRQTPITIVGLSGGAGVGKDTLAERYFQRYGFHPLALADEIKRRIVAAGRATFEEVYITKPPHIRTLLQEEGTERGRDVYGENYWVDMLKVNMAFFNIRWGFDKFVITDVRFPNEVTELQAVGGKVAKIIAPQRYRENGMSEAARQHRSERALDDFTAFDATIANDIGQETRVGDQIANFLRTAFPALITAGDRASVHTVRLGV